MEKIPSTQPYILRLSLTVVFVALIVSSPIIMLVNPALAITALPTISTIPSAPSTIGQSGSESDFTTQAALTGVSARQTNNIVGVQSYYDVVFTTTTTGTIKFIDIAFPAGTVIGASPLLVEREGIGTGTAAKTSATVIRYTVDNAVSVPAGTQIRLEFFNIVNPTAPSTGYKVTVTTRNAAGTPIDGPTLSNSLNMKQIGTDQIADFSVTGPKLGTSSVTSSKIASDSLFITSIQRPGSVVNVPQNIVTSATASCLGDEELVGGGHTFGADNAFDVRYIDAIETGFNTWNVRGLNVGTGAVTLQAFALCIPFSIP